MYSRITNHVDAVQKISRRAEGRSRRRRRRRSVLRTSNLVFSCVTAMVVLTTTMMMTMMSAVNTVDGFGLPSFFRPNISNPKKISNIGDRNVGGEGERPTNKAKKKESDTATTTTTTSSKFTYRKANVDDVPSIARLVFDAFDDDDDEDDSEENSLEEDSHSEQQLKELGRMFQDRIQSEQFRGNAMIIAVANNSGVKDANDVVGFMELGSMPSPTDSRSQFTIERPYLANLCVDPSCRRYGVGTKLVKLALKISSSTSTTTTTNNNNNNEDDDYLFLSVENDNIKALQFYDSLGFVDMGIPYSTNTKTKTKTSTLERVSNEIDDNAEDSKSGMTSTTPISSEADVDDSAGGDEEGNHVYNWGAVVSQNTNGESNTNEVTNIPSTTTNTKIYLRKSLF